MDDIEERVNNAIGSLLENDSQLLIKDANERTLTQRLAAYLEPLFEGWNVDCEYNRDLDSVKRLRMRLKPDGPISDRAVLPDIIVHRRGTPENLLVVEVKKSTNRLPDDQDLRKLEAFQDQLGYRYACFMRFAAGEEAASLQRSVWLRAP